MLEVVRMQLASETKDSVTYVSTLDDVLERGTVIVLSVNRKIIAADPPPPIADMILNLSRGDGPLH